MDLRFSVNCIKTLATITIHATQMNTCQECDKSLMGRIDKKFCSDTCRNAYNNRINSDVTGLIRNTNNQLRKNRRILEELCPDEKAKASKSFLVGKGFDFNLITHLRTTQKGSVYYFVYDFGYLALENDYYLIVKDNRAEK